MTILKFQPESITKTKAAQSESLPLHQSSDDSIITKLESSILGLCLRRKLSPFDEATLDSVNPGSEQLFIVLENRFVYPENADSDNYAYGLVFCGRDLNVCDLKNKHPYLAGKIEHAWPSIISAAGRISEIFEKTEAALVINRSSGRIVANSKSFTATTGLVEDKIIGHEYGSFSKNILKAFSGKRINIENLRLDEIYVSVISFSSPNTIINSNSDFTTAGQIDNLTHHRIVDENETIERHFRRLNSVLKANLQSSIAGESLSKVEEIINSLSFDPNQKETNIDSPFHSPNFTAVLRLLLQTVLISHHVASDGLLNTKMHLTRTERGINQITFETNIMNGSKSKTNCAEWLKLAQKLAAQIGLKLTEPQITEKKIVNTIQLTMESTNANANKN